ncbi:hypothetical protein C1646_767681 [Rhizophagus diaphanus]|nr:hypothetical protein C1646_767681 [Rhizophagus diaphanus] [Rhizophagus sp. MUCL 43196]
MPRDLKEIDQSKLPAQYRKKLIKIELQAYDNNMKLNIPVLKLKIRQNDDGLNEIEEIQKLLDQYSNFISDGLISAKEFILIDDNDNYGGEEITDEENVNMIKPNETEKN